MQGLRKPKNLPFYEGDESAELEMDDEFDQDNESDDLNDMSAGDIEADDMDAYV